MPEFLIIFDDSVGCSGDGWRMFQGASYSDLGLAGIRSGIRLVFSLQQTQLIMGHPPAYTIGSDKENIFLRLL